MSKGLMPSAEEIGRQAIIVLACAVLAKVFLDRFPRVKAWLKS